VARLLLALPDLDLEDLELAAEIHDAVEHAREDPRVDDVAAELDLLALLAPGLRPRVRLRLRR
jgi:hypothetical protein